MKNLIKTLIISVFVLSLSGCSNIKVLASWKADNARDIMDNKVLVIARTNNTQARVAFENEIAKAMQEKGTNAIPSFTILPENLNIMDKPTDSSKKAFRDLLDKEGFDGIVLSVVKNENETTKTYTDGGYYAGASVPFYPSFYSGFYTYYYHPMSYQSSGTYVETTSTSYTYVTYVLETVAYDLTKEEGDRLVAVVTSKIENPQDMSRNAESYTQKIVKALK